MKINNIIQSATNSSGWTSFTTTVTSTGVFPTFGSSSVIQSYYLQQGKNLLLTLSITTAGSGSSNGNGMYLFNLPLGFTMNTSIVTFSLSNFSLGSASCYLQTNGDQGMGVAIAYNATQYALYLYSRIGTTTNYVGNSGTAWFVAGNQPNYGAILQIPIL